MAQGTQSYVKKAVEAKEEEIESHIVDPFNSISTKNQNIVDEFLHGDKRNNVEDIEYEQLQKMFPKLKMPMNKGKIARLLKPSNYSEK
jgi:hypothetical protein